MTVAPAYRAEFSSFGEFLQAVVRFGIDGRFGCDPRLEMKAVAGANATVPSEGAFLVPGDFALDLWTRVYDTGRLLNRCTRQPVTRSDKLTIPAIDERNRVAGSRFGGTRTYWLNEGEAPPSTKPKYAELVLQLKKLMALSYATDELLADTPALGAWLERIFGLEASFEIENQTVNGDGAGKMLGLLNADALITVAAESGQSAGTILPANLKNMAARLWGPSHRTAVWLMSNEVFAQIADASFSNGTPVVVNGAAGNRSVLGMPLELTEYTPALGSIGDVVLGDFSQYLIGEKEPDLVSSIHVRFLYDEGAFKFRYRVDGHPAWASAVTPNNSNVTQSPFIALAERA